MTQNQEPTTHEARLQLLCRREERAREMGGAEKLARRQSAGLLNARSRIDALLDPGSFVESGLLGVFSVIESDRDITPADGKVDQRLVGVVSNDFTVKGASSSLTNMKKIGHVKRVATERGFPLVFFGESSGARMPDNMGARGMGSLLGNDPLQYVRPIQKPGSRNWRRSCVPMPRRCVPRKPSRSKRSSIRGKPGPFCASTSRWRRGGCGRFAIAG